MINKNFKSDPQDLLAVLDKLQNQPVLVVGDIMLDRYLWGAVERISAEAPVPVVDVREMENRLGGAANVANNLKALGAKPVLCGIIGADSEGIDVLGLLDSLGMSKAGILRDRDRPTSLKTRIISQRQQMIRIDRESRDPLSAVLEKTFSDLVESFNSDCRSVVISDYGKGVIRPALMRKFAALRASGTLGYPLKPLIIDPHPANFGIYDQACILKPNRKEAEQASGIKIDSMTQAVKAAEILIDKWQAAVIFLTLGEDGVLIFEKGGNQTVLPTVAREVFDVSGAGDTVTAALSAALAAGTSLHLAGELANLAAGIAVSEIGTVAVTADKIRDVLLN
jgi:rfaE bifunctional protein kinase chain/domain